MTQATPAAPKAPTKAQRLRALLRDERPVVSPGIYDGYSLLLVEAMGFKTAATSGSALSNSLIVQPDISILSLRENVDACRHFARAVSIPLMADADTGYGNAVTVHHVVQYFEEAGIVGINIEDQLIPKRCGHMRGKELVEPIEMAMKIEAAVKAKKDPDFIINARTDAIAVEGIEATVARVKMYAAAGADMIYPDAVRDEDDIRRIVDAVPDLPVNIGMGFGVRARPTTPLIPLRRLKELGVARASMPRLLSGSALSGMKKALEVQLRCMETGEAADRPDLLVSMEELTRLVGYDRIAALEQNLLTEEQLERKYGDAERHYVIRKESSDAYGT
jgi:2-methylisocitrate lyase-like PEP mutase family enzyme